MAFFAKAQALTGITARGARLTEAVCCLGQREAARRVSLLGGTEGRLQRGKFAKTRANRELALMGHLFNRAIDLEVIPWPNPCGRVHKFVDKGLSRYVTDDELRAVRNAACQPLRDALDLSYLLGSSPEDT